MTEHNDQPMSAKILRHIADLHEAGIIADDAKVAEKLEECNKSYDPVEAADYFIACISNLTRDACRYDAPDLPAAIAKNERRLAWMKAHPDQTKTPLELWEEAKRADENKENGND